MPGGENVIDFHTHILPGIDDGCETAEEALECLRCMKENGIQTAVATPHFYREKSSVEEFLEKRRKALEKVKAAAQREKSEIPDILLGAEVAFFPGISRFEQIERLCIGNTRYIMIEMPFEKWDSFVIAELENLIASGGIIPIIAHIERYPGYRRKIPELLRLQLPIQTNAGSLLKIRGSEFLIKCIRNGTIQLIGSDCHNTYSRPPNVHRALHKIERKLGSEYLRRLRKIWTLMLNSVRRE